MGFGGITALGCTIGQAVTGISTLALGSIVTFVAGAALEGARQRSRAFLDRRRRPSADSGR